MKRILLLSSFLFCVLFGQLRMKRVVFLQSGLYQGSYGQIVCGDINHNGLNELVFKTREDVYPYYQRWEIWEYRPINSYELAYADTGWPAYGQWPLGIETGNLFPFTGGLLDQDSVFDLVGPNKENFHPDTTPRPLTTVMEGPSPSAYPINLVWFDGLSGAFNVAPHYVTDLDQDNRKEIIFSWYGTKIYENIGNNQYNVVFHQSPGGVTYAFGDFDQDTRNEFVTPATLTHIFIRKCIGNNQYPVVCSLPFPFGLTNPHDCWDGRDVDQDGRPEFFIAFDVEPTFSLYMWEATGNNTYERTFIAQNPVSGSSRRGSRISKCGDIDGDGIEEIVWATHKNLTVYKATGNNQFQLVWAWWQDHGDPSVIVNIYDMNRNGYKEIVVGGSGKTSIFEVEAVRLIRPNGGEVFQYNTQELIQWQKFYPPRCDSISLFYSTNNGRTYLPLASGISGSDTSYLWTVPNVNSDSCKIKIIAYGPGWQYDESDGTFSIISTGIEENLMFQVSSFTLQVLPNPVKSLTAIRYTLPAEGKVSMQLYDISGRLVKTLVNEHKKPGTYSITLNSKTLSSGVYFLSLKSASQRIIERLVIVK